MDLHFDPVVLKLVSILKRALPDYTDEDIFWGYHFVTGADEHPRKHRPHRSSLGRHLPLKRFPRGQETHGQVHGAGFLALKHKP